MLKEAVGFRKVSFVYCSMKITVGEIEIFYIFFMSLANWLGAMFGYDKIKQILNQIGSNSTSTVNSEDK